MARLAASLPSNGGEVEVVFVDDASGDGTAELAGQLAKRELPCETSVLVLPENRGVFFAREAGLKAAKQAFVTFVDADDHWEAGYFETLLERLRQTKADVVLQPIRSRVPGWRTFHVVGGDWSGRDGTILSPEEMMWGLAKKHLGFSGLWGRSMRRGLALAVWQAESAYTSYVDNDNNLLWRLYHLAHHGIELLTGPAYVWDQHIGSTRYNPAYRQGIFQDKLLSFCALHEWLRPEVGKSLWAAIEARWGIELKSNLFDANGWGQTLTDPQAWSTFQSELLRDYPMAGRKVLAAARNTLLERAARPPRRLRHLHVICTSWPPGRKGPLASEDVTWWLVLPDDAPQPDDLPAAVRLLQAGPVESKSQERMADIALEHIVEGHVMVWHPELAGHPEDVLAIFSGQTCDAATLELPSSGQQLHAFDRFLIGADRWGWAAQAGEDLQAILLQRSRHRRHVRQSSL